MAEDIIQERGRRQGIWNALVARGGPTGVRPAVLRDLGIYGGAQGIWVDKSRTAVLNGAPQGVTVGVLHTGSTHPDDLSEDGILYHYPKTNRPPTRDASEIAATKAAGELGLPIFVITHAPPSSARRDVQLGWVEGWNDEAKLFLITFAEAQPPLLVARQEESQPFAPFEHVPRARREATARAGQQRFKFRVVQRYGAQCAVCGLRVMELLDAAHIIPKSERGSDDPRNGLVLCANHHRAFDAGLFAIEPELFTITTRDREPDREELFVSYLNLGHLPLAPHLDAVVWRWQLWKAEHGDEASQHSGGPRGVCGRSDSEPADELVRALVHTDVLTPERHDGRNTSAGEPPY